MLTGGLRSQVDSIWNDFWAGGIANPRVQLHRLHPTHPAADPSAGGYEGDGVLLRRSRLTQPARPVRDFLSAAFKM